MTPSMRENYKLYISADKIGVRFSRDGGDTIYNFPTPGLPPSRRLPPQDGDRPPIDLRVYQLSRNTRKNRISPRAPSKFVEEPLVPLWGSQLQKSVQEPLVAPPSQRRLEPSNPVKGAPVAYPSQEMLQPAGEGVYETTPLQQSQQPAPFAVDANPEKLDTEPDSWNMQPLPPLPVSLSSAFSANLSLPSTVGNESYNSSLPTRGPPRERFGPSKYPSPLGGQYGNMAVRQPPPPQQLGPGLRQNRPLLAGGLSPITPRYYGKQSRLPDRNLPYRSSSAAVQFNPVIKPPSIPNEQPGFSARGLLARPLSTGVNFSPSTETPLIPDKQPGISAHSLLAMSLSTGVQFGPPIKGPSLPDEQSRISAHILLAKSLSTGVQFSPRIRNPPPPDEQPGISAHGLLARPLSTGVQFSPHIRDPLSPDEQPGISAHGLLPTGVQCSPPIINSSPPDEQFGSPPNHPSKSYRHMNDSGSRQPEPPSSAFHNQAQLSGAVHHRLSELSRHTNVLAPGVINSPSRLISLDAVTDYRRIEKTNSEADNGSRFTLGRPSIPLPPRNMPERMFSPQPRLPQARSQISAASMSGPYGSNTHQAANRMGPPGYYQQPQRPGAFHQLRSLSGPCIRNGDRQFFPQPLRRGFGYPSTSYSNIRAQMLSQQQSTAQQDYVRDGNGNFIVNQPGDEPQFRVEERHQMRAERDLANAYAEHQAQVQSQLAMAQTLMNVVSPGAPMRLTKARDLVALAEVCNLGESPLRF